MTLNNDINFYEGVFAISIYAIFSYLITLLTNKSIISRRLLIGSPTVIIEDGKLNYNSLKKSKLDLNDFLFLFRNKSKIMIPIGFLIKVISNVSTAHPVKMLIMAIQAMLISL